MSSRSGVHETAAVEPTGAGQTATLPGSDADRTQDWVADLREPGPRQAQALSQLHRLMLRAAGHQVLRMRSQLAGLDDGTINDLINESADEAMTAVLAKLDTFAQRSRFTTWAYKFAILEAASAVRRTAWRDREIPLMDAESFRDIGTLPAEQAEADDLAAALASAIATVLTRRQRRVTIALLLDLVPIDVLADRLQTNRNALYKTLHDSRAKLRDYLVATGHLPQDASASAGRMGVL